MNPDAEQLRDFFAGRGVDMESHDAVFGVIRAAAVMVSVMEERALRALGLSHAGYRLLCELWIRGPLEPRELAGFMMVSRPSIIGTLDTLEAGALVERRRSTTDRRLSTVSLTEAGLVTVERADAEWHRCQVEVTASLSPAEKAAVAALSRSLAGGALELRARP